jgi:hypothetical protein
MVFFAVFCQSLFVLVCLFHKQVTTRLSKQLFARLAIWQAELYFYRRQYHTSRQLGIKTASSLQILHKIFLFSKHL